MKVLVTGAKGFVGQNLCMALRNIAEGKDRREKYRDISPLVVYEYGRDGTQEELSFYCSQADFVFNLVGINRTEDDSEFMKGNYGFGERLLNLLEHHGNACPVMLSSSIQASLDGRYANSLYGKSKLAGEELLFEHSDRTGAAALVYRFPNLYGKWCRPRYNSVVATFCDAIANGREYTVNDPSAKLELLYIDDLIAALLDALVGDVKKCSYAGSTCIPDENGKYCYVEGSQCVTLGEIVELLRGFKAARDNRSIPDVTDGSFSKKLYSTYLSYLSPEDFAYKLYMNQDERGSFTEILHTADRGQVSVNVSRPGVTKGQHWHNTKWEKFCVVSGEALIQMRRVGKTPEGDSYPVHEFRVSGEEITVVEMIPGYTHNIINLSATSNLVTLMWCNENFDSNNPDTFFCEVQALAPVREVQHGNGC